MQRHPRLTVVRSSAARRGLTATDVVVAILVIALLGTLLPVAAQQVRASARQQQCRNNLKMIALACHNYHDVHMMFPPGWIEVTARADAGPSYGWQTGLLPYMEQGPIFNKLKWRGPAQDSPSLFKLAIPLYRCPEDPTEVTNPMRGGYGTSNYSGNQGAFVPPRWAPGPLAEFWPGAPDDTAPFHGIFGRNHGVRLRDITDGTSNTFLAGERCLTSASGIWFGVRANDLESDQVTDCAFGNEINSGMASFSSLHPGGTDFALCDGSVRFISESIPSRAGIDAAMGVYQKMAGRDDGQPIGDTE